MSKIDRIDSKGNIREHDVSSNDPNRTACGLLLVGVDTQSPCGNARCGRCDARKARIVAMARKSYTIGVAPEAARKGES